MNFFYSSLFKSIVLHFLFILPLGLLLLSDRTVDEGSLLKFKVIEKQITKKRKVEINISTSSKSKKKNPKKLPLKKIRKVFGINRKSIKNQTGVQTKRGNTIVKKFDNERLKKDDLDDLPIPKAEYLVTEMPSVLSESKIIYPKKAKNIKLEGTVILSILIDDKGIVRDVSVVEGLIPEMNEEAVRAIKTYRFSPARIDETPVSVRIRYAINFILEES